MPFRERGACDQPERRRGRAAAKLLGASAPGVSCFINFGGDVAALSRRRDDDPWRVGIERAEQTHTPVRIVHLERGALATSSDSRRYALRDGIRYSHILDARTGWPVRNAPRSITVAADTCTQAGTLTTLAMLHGYTGAFLRDTGVQYWLQ